MAALSPIHHSSGFWTIHRVRTHWHSRSTFGTRAAKLPGNIAQVETRRKEIQYSSRTRAGTDYFKYAQRMRNAVASLLDKLPEDLKESEEAKLLRANAERKDYNIIQLIYHARNYEGHAKDYEFSRASMEAHWSAGLQRYPAYTAPSQHGWTSNKR